MDIQQLLLIVIGLLALFIGIGYYLYSLNRYGEGGMSVDDINFKNAIVSDLKKNNQLKADVIQNEINNVKNKLGSTYFLNFKKKKMLSDILSVLEDIKIDLKSK